MAVLPSISAARANASAQAVSGPVNASVMALLTHWTGPVGASRSHRIAAATSAAQTWTDRCRSRAG